MQNKILPHSLETEKSLVGAMIIDESIINLIDLKQEDFYNEVFGKIFNLCKKLKSHGKKVDLIVLKEYLEKNNILSKIGGMSFLVELVENSNSIFWQDYKNIIKEKSDRRKIITYARRMEQMGFEETEEMKNILEKIENISENIFSLKEKENNGDLEDFVNSYEEIKQTMQKNKGYLGMIGPFPQVDKYTRGFIKGKVYTLVAFSNTGKSQFSYNFVSDFLRKGKRIDYYSLEVDKGFLFKDLLRNYYGKDDYEMTYKDSFYNLEDFENLKIYDSVKKFEDIKTMIKTNRPDFVFIDFLQNIQLGGSEYEKMSKIAVELQALAIETKTTIFSLSQVSNDDRFSDNQRIMPKGSGALFSNSDVLFSLHRDGEELFFSIVKNKYGPNNKKFLINANFDKNIFKLAEEFNSKREITY
ncbi:hypothetical protein DLH72_01255 [Candidatus Gracilibacteria bacterium]|nr:MAG: hypothetical protein DLH72_01255 [Candidatus Gracilibacteria bacterium]